MTLPLLQRRHLTLLGLAAPLLAAAGTPGVDEPPAAQPPRPVTVPPFTESTLANGLTVVSAPRHDTPLVSLMLMVRAGAERDPPGHAGVAAMTAGLLTKGARRQGRPVGAAELARQAEALGAALDTGSSWRASTVAMTVTTPRAAAALALMADMLRNPLLTAEELARSRAQALDGLRVTLGDPGQLAGMVLRRAHWGGTAYGQLVAPAAVQRLSRDEVLRFHATHYRPEQTVLVVAGDLSPAQAQALAQRLLGDWRVSTPAPPPAPQAEARPTLPALVLLDMPGTGQSGVAVAAPFNAGSAAERRIGQVASAVLGGGYSARLNQEIRIKRGLSYGAGANAELHPGAGMLSASAQTNHPTAAQVLQILRDEVSQLAEHPPTTDELAARQATLVGSFARRLDTIGGLSALVMGQLAQNRPLADLGRYVADVQAVTPQQVSDFARAHWSAGQLHAVIAGDLAAAGDSLKPLLPGALRLGLPELDLEQAGLRKTP